MKHLETYDGEFETHPQKDILNYIFRLSSKKPEYRISKYTPNEFKDFSDFVTKRMPHTSYGQKHDGADTNISIKNIFDYGLCGDFIYDNETKNFDYEKHINKQNDMHESLKSIDGSCLCIHEYLYDNECCDNIDIDEYICVMANSQNGYPCDNNISDLLGFEYSHMIEHTKFKPFIFSYEEFKNLVDKRNAIIKKYDGKSLYSIVFDDDIEEFEQTETIEYDGNQLELLCSSKKYYYHIIARR